MRRILGAFALLALVLLGVVAIRTARFRPETRSVEPVAPLTVDADVVAAHLSEAIRIPTVSHEEPERTDWAVFERFLAYLAQRYPALHRTLERERVGRAGLLFRWPGRDPTLEPLVLMAHYDVVPVQPGTEPDWDQPPWGGVVADGFVWGRGALDDKGSTIAICEAVERLVGERFRPERTLWLAFGHDEEVGGPDGAARAAARLAERGVVPALVLDEGGAIATPGLIPGVDETVALVGVAEKGYLSLELRVRAEGGHSSRPPPHSGVGILASAIHRLERNQLPRRIRGAARGLLMAVGPAQGLARRVALANLWLTEPLVVRALGRSSIGNALLRTTTAATMFEGSPKDNVLPIHARAVVNFRILPGDTRETVIEHVRRVVDDARIEIAQHGSTASDPSPVADTEAWGFRVVERTIHEVFPHVLVAPNLVLGATDARHFGSLTPQVLRFLPFPVSAEDLARAHGTNERLGVAALARGVGFYVRLLHNALGRQAMS